MQGKIRKYDDQRGFGFIKCADSNHVFFHISECVQRVPEPAVGDLVEFSLSSDRDGRLCAKGVQRINPPGDPCGPIRFGDIGIDEAA